MAVQKQLKKRKGKTEMAHYVKVPISKRRIITMWNPQKPLFPVSEADQKAADEKFIAEMQKEIARKRKEIKRQEKLYLDYLGISDSKLLRKNTKNAFNKFLATIDKTEQAEKFNKNKN